MRTIEAYLRNYALELPRLKELSEKAELLVREILKSSGVEIHQISSRVKSTSSLRRKIRRKNYDNPRAQVTDRVGVRVITFYAPDVYRVEDQLRREFRVNKKKSSDKLILLGPREFGLRTVQLVVQLDAKRSQNAEYALLRGAWFEIQVRSILEHAWAEIEHRVVYKSGVEYPAHVRRQFAAAAGALEMLDREFYAMKLERDRLIEKYKVDFGNKIGLKEKLDSARLLAVLEMKRPHGLSWRQASEQGKPFPHQIEAACVEALAATRINTPAALVAALKSSTFQSSCRRFAAHAGISNSDVSHLAIIALVVGSLNLDTLYHYLEEISLDPSINAALNRGGQ